MVHLSALSAAGLRQAAARKYRRDTDDLVAWEAVNHNMTGSSSNGIFPPLEDVFSANTSCVLAPEVTDGPYYIVGEYMRSNLIESEWCEGVPVFLEVQYVDVNSARATKPMSQLHNGSPTIEQERQPSCLGNHLWRRRERLPDVTT